MAEALQTRSGAGVRRFTFMDHFFVSCFWMAFNIHWGALGGIVLPSQIAAIVGPENKEFFNGIIPPVGAVFSLLLTPVVGAFSDRSRSRYGRRRPFLLSGTLINVLFLILIAGFGTGSNIWLFVLCYVGIQIGNNWMGGPYAGLIPDVVPNEQRGTASGWMAVMSSVGTFVGALAAGQLIRDGNYWPIYILIAVSMLIMLAFTLVGVREQPRTDDPGPFDIRAFLGSFFKLDYHTYRDFYWVLITRGMVTMGIYTIFTFFQYYLKDMIGVPDPETQTSYLIAIMVVVGIPVSMVAGALSDRVGRKPLVYLSGIVMTISMLIFIPIALVKSMPLVYVVSGIFGIGFGAYQAVDWALAVDVLPKGDDAAKDMGIWHVAIVLPQVIAPAISGIILDLMKGYSLMAGYALVFVLTAVWYILGTFFVREVKGVR